MKAARFTFYPIAAMAVTLLVFTSCGGKDVDEKGGQPQAQIEEQKKPEIGKPEVSEASGVVESREVKRTISSEIPAVKVTEIRGDLNRMNETNLEVLGVSQELASNIVRYRSEQGGKFSSVDQLKQVPGMNANTFNQLKQKVAVAR